MNTSDRYEPDEWRPDGRKISDPAQLDAMREEIERRGPVVLRHWHYRGARMPSHVAFDDFDDLVEYFEKHARPGDAFDAWALSGLCDGIGTLAAGKYPDDDGCVPKLGAY